MKNKLKRIVPGFLICASILFLIGCTDISTDEVAATLPKTDDEVDKLPTDTNQSLEPVYEDFIIGFAVEGEDCYEWSVGALKNGTAMNDVINALGEPEEETEAECQGYDNDFHKSLSYKSKGISIGVQAEEEHGDYILSSLNLEAPFSGKTVEGIGIGSSEAEVKNAYGDIINLEDSSSHCIVLGSTFGGVHFGIENGVVCYIYFGASAE